MEQVELLKRALERSEISFYPGLIDKFSKYREILLSWNRRMNLISRRDEGRVVTRHFLESLGLVKAVAFPLKARVVDLGSGAGFPGIPMKLVRPDLRVILVEAKRKRVLFLRQVVEELCLTGVEVVLGRVEEVGDKIEPVDFVVSRSVADLVTLSEWSMGCLKPRGGELIVIKGPGVEKELDHLSAVASDLGVKGWRVIPYNPFPEVFPLRESFVVLIEKG